MPSERGSIPQVVRNLFGGHVPIGRRLVLAARNSLRRFGPPPRACCDHPGEPGC